MQQLPRTHMPLRGPLRFVTNHSRFAHACAPEEEEANAAVSCCTRLFPAKCFMIPERILVQTPALMVF